METRSGGGNPLSGCPEGSTEIGIHPGWDEQWRRLDTQPVLEHGRQFLEDRQIRVITFAEYAGMAADSQAGIPCA